MPIYAYACQRWGHELDALQKISDEPLVDCPACGAPELKKLLSAPRFRLKGSGWYETDFKTDNQRNLASDDKPNSDGKKEDKKGDSKDGGVKTAKKTESKTSSESA